LSRVYAIRDKLMTDTLFPYVGTELVGEWFDAMVEDISLALDVSKDVVIDSVRYLAGSVLFRPDAFILAWHLAGNIDLLRDGTPSPRWFVQQAEEWLPCEVLDYMPSQTARGKPSNDYTLRVLAGSACPMRVIAAWPTSFVRMLARQIGFSNHRSKLPFQHPSELVRMRLRVLADPARSKPGQLGFWEVSGGSGLNKWNRDILKKRARIDFACPEGYTHACYRCPVGYLNCVAATHRLDTESPKE
jgi:hypothetical protein